MRWKIIFCTVANHSVTICKMDRTDPETPIRCNLQNQKGHKLEV